jgi:DNA end-binding protein Ku
MAARSIWKGTIKFFLVTIPVKVYNALEKSENISFNQLHQECLGPIGYKKECKKCGQVVDNEQIVKGYQHEKDQYIVIDQEEIEKIKPTSNEAIEITGFIRPEEIPTPFFDASYFAMPEGVVAKESYALLRDVMRRTGRIAIAKVILREREELVTISPNENGLLIQKLHYRHEVRAINSMPGALSSDTVINSAQLDMAAQLVENMITSFDQLDTEDHFHTELKKLVDARITGKEITSTTATPKATNVLDIMDALKRSLAANTTKPATEEPVTETDAPTAPITADESPASSTQPLLTLVATPAEKPARKRRVA